MNTANLFLLFLFAITLHNIEEALWLPTWSEQVQKFSKPVGKSEFIFAVLVITLLAYLATGLYIFFPQNLLLKYFFFGFLGAMILNAIMPHLIATIILKKYCPGLITGMFLIIPFNSLIIVYSVNNQIINYSEVIASTIGVAVVLLALIPILKNAGRKLICYK